MYRIKTTNLVCWDMTYESCDKKSLINGHAQYISTINQKLLFIFILWPCKCGIQTNMQTHTHTHQKRDFLVSVALFCNAGYFIFVIFVTFPFVFLVCNLYFFQYHIEECWKYNQNVERLFANCLIHMNKNLERPLYACETKPNRSQIRFGLLFEKNPISLQTKTKM